jgi:hypothetical protein
MDSSSSDLSSFDAVLDSKPEIKGSDEIQNPWNTSRFNASLENFRILSCLNRLAFIMVFLRSDNAPIDHFYSM